MSHATSSMCMPLPSLVLVGGVTFEELFVVALVPFVGLFLDTPLVESAGGSSLEGSATMTARASGRGLFAAIRSSGKRLVRPRLDSRSPCELKLQCSSVLTAHFLFLPNPVVRRRSRSRSEE